MPMTEERPNRPAWPRGELKVTRQEYGAARKEGEDDAFQVVRYCRGEIYGRAGAERWLTSFRARMEPGKALTRDLGIAIADLLEQYADGGATVHVLKDEDGELNESGHIREVLDVDRSDPDNLKVRLDNGQTFTVRIVSP